MQKTLDGILSAGWILLLVLLVHRLLVFLPGPIGAGLTQGLWLSVVLVVRSWLGVAIGYYFIIWLAAKWCLKYLVPPADDER